jgi:hypothetical protein
MTNFNITNICSFVEDLEKRLKKKEALFEQMFVCFKSAHVSFDVKNRRQMEALFKQIFENFRDMKVSRRTLCKLCEGLNNQSRYR